MIFKQLLLILLYVGVAMDILFCFYQLYWYKIVKIIENADCSLLYAIMIGDIILFYNIYYHSQEELAFAISIIASFVYKNLIIKIIDKQLLKK